MKGFIKKSKVKAFTLTELVIVLVIIGVLLLLAVPKLVPLVAKTNSTEAQMSLGHVHALQKNFFYLNSEYANDLKELGYKQEALVTDGGTANYLVEIIEAGSNTFIARATSVVDFDSDGRFSTWEIDQNKKLIEVIRD